MYLEMILVLLALVAFAYLHRKINLLLKMVSTLVYIVTMQEEYEDEPDATISYTPEYVTELENKLKDTLIPPQEYIAKQINIDEESVEVITDAEERDRERFRRKH